MNEKKMEVIGQLVEGGHADLVLADLLEDDDDRLEVISYFIENDQIDVVAALLEAEDVDVDVDLDDDDDDDFEVEAAVEVEAKRKKRVEPSALRVGEKVAGKMERDLAKELKMYIKKKAGAEVGKKELYNRVGYMTTKIARVIGLALQSAAKSHKPKK